MLQKWKIILGNWINCYFEEDSKKEFPVTLDSLVNIISHLRENFNLDESKSALLDAHTIQEFLLEKYPSFRFENGTVEPINEEEIYMAASLLLFFVCINSKDVDIKSAMCNKLSGSDQKTILKFTKCLMECSNISSLDVLTAIAEACGQDVAASEMETFKVAETPPALRSLHSEVRRLQAALDAERFDRNYLQEELARTNLKMEKLLKDKEQYKQDIVNLKAKILCCGQEDDSKAETSISNSAKLSKQLEETEERLVSVQERLDDVQYERDIFKNKLDELKHERDKWFTISQKESNKVAQLVDELETERHHVHSLKELVTELKQHNRLNGLDSSQLECDDLDASVQSLPHNTSVCSEACANIIEVQLSEERAKIVLLKQQMQMLQDQLNDLTKKSEEEHRNLTHIISEKDTDIFNLKHRINEEIEDKNALKVHYDNEVTKLNNEVNELEQRLRDTGENSRRIIDSKMKEIQTLQEEKMSLLQSLSDEITKFDNIIKDLKADIDSEKTSKLKMREEYEKQMMKLKEKVSNRNNELVELQNKIFEKGEMIEILQSDLRKEKEISNKYNNDVKNLTTQIQAYENDLRQKSEEVLEFQKQIQQYTMYNEQLNMDLQHVKSCLTKSNEDCKVLEEHNNKLKVEIQNRDVKIEKIQKDFEAQEIINIEEKKKLQYNLDEINATVDALKTQLQNEIEYKIRIQNELEEVKNANSKLTEDISLSNSKLNKIIANNKELEKLLTEEKENSENLRQKCSELNNTVEHLNINVIEKDSIITLTKKDLDDTKTHFDEQCAKMNELIDSFKIKLKHERSENNDMKQKLDVIEKEKMNLAVTLQEKDKIGADLLMENKTLSQKAKENEIIIKNLEDNLSEKTKTLENIIIDFDVESNKLMTKINDMDKTVKELHLTSNNTIQSKDLEIDRLKLDIEELQSTLQTEKEKIVHVDHERTNLIQQLEKVNVHKDKMEKEYLNKCTLLNSLNNELNGEIAHKNEKIDKLENELENVLKDNKTKIEEINTLKLNIEQAFENSKELCDKKDSDIKELCLKIENLEALLAKSQEELKMIVYNNDQLIKTLQKENIQLHHTIEEDNSSHKLLIEEKDKVIETLEIELKNKANMLNQLQNDFEHEKLTREQLQLDMQQQISIKTDQISELTEKALNNQAQLDEKEVFLKAMDAQLNCLRDEKIRLNNEIDSLRNTYNESAHTNDVLKDNLNKEKVEKETLETKIQNLIQENQALSIKIDQIEDSYKKVIYERDSLLNEKAILVQQLMEEKSILKIADEGKEALLLEKRKVEEQLKELQGTRNTLVQEKECLTQQLVDERLSKELAEKEKESLNIVKIELEDKLNEETIARAEYIGKIDCLSKEIEKITKDNEHKNVINTELQKDVINLKQKIDILKEENNHMIINIESLKKYQLEYEKNLELIIQEKTALVNEKETLKECLDKLRHDCEKLKSENVALEEKVQEITITWSSEVNNKQEQLKQMSIDLNSLKSDYKTLEEDNSKIVTVLNCGLNKVLDNIKRDEVCSKILEKYEIVEKENILKNCDVIFKFISDLSSELSLKKNLEKALEDEDLVIKELSEKVNQKETEISQLEMEVQNLKKVIDDSKTESAKQKERYTSLLEKKTQDIQQLKIENDSLNHELNDLKQQLDIKVHSLKDKLEDNENLTEKLKKTYDCQIDNLNMMVSKLTNYLKEKSIELELVRNEKEKLKSVLEENNTVRKSLEEELKVQKQKQDKLITDFESERQVLNNMVSVTESMMEDQKVNLNKIICEHVKTNETLENEVKILKDAIENEKTNFDIKLKEKDDMFINNIETLNKEIMDLHTENDAIKNDFVSQNEVLKNKIIELEENIVEKSKCIETIMNENKELNEKTAAYEIKSKEYEQNIAKLEKRQQLELDRQKQINEQDKINLVNKCAILDEYQQKAEMELESRQKEISNLQKEIKTLTFKTQESINEKDNLLVQLKEEKDAMINTLKEQLNKEKQNVDNIKIVLELKQAEVLNLKNELDQKNQEDNIVQILRKENEELIKVIGQRETFAATSQERSGPKYSGQAEKDRDHQQQVVTTSSDTHSSMESYKTITDLEKIVQDKNRTITTLQSDITYLKSIIAESENNLLDVSKELELSKENCQQLSSQLKKIVHQKNEEIAELRKQVTKMSVTENRASQIIKVSAKYQAIILKRIAEIKSNTVLKELTNFGNSNCDNDIRRSITAGTITMEDLENFLETTERHIRRCSDKQIALQKERDRLTEINRISESEIVNMRKFLTELSVSMKTFNSVKDLYTQKLSRVVFIQRTVRREILSLDGRVNDATMCKLERGYAAVIQDMAECTMNLERWIDRCVSRAISPEKIKQAFTSDADRISLATGTFQNTSLEVQIDELQKSFEKLLEDVSRAQKGEGAKDTQLSIMMEVRADYEDKLNRMKAKMKQLLQEQIAAFRENQKKDIAGLEMELQKTQDKLKEYEDHIKSLTAELWKVGEKFLVKKDEADWLKKKQRSGSLMSLQHVHSSGLVPPLEEPLRPSDACSLRSLPVTNQREDKTGRTLQMSDEEGEVFDNRWLRSLETPRREPPPRDPHPARRLSELRWRNSLCPPHLKSSYPAETQFAPALQEEDIKCTGAMSLGGKPQRKEVGITAYKKPGPPTPSKQAGRLSATDSELRESLRVEAEPGARKTSTPSRIRALFRSNKNDTAEGTPRSRRLSNMFRKK